MTINQFLNLLAVLAWPTVATIAAWALLRGIRLLVDAAAAKNRLLDQCRKDLSFYHGYWSTAYCEQRQDNNRAQLTKTCELAMLAVLQANGGFPSAPGDKVGRQLVREIREMYAELERPTQAPERKRQQQVTDFGVDFSDLDDDVDDDDLLPDEAEELP